VVVSGQDAAHLVSVVGPIVAEVPSAREVQNGVRSLPCEAAMMAGSWADDPLGGGLIVLIAAVWAVSAIIHAAVKDCSKRPPTRRKKR
jgi:hypothetical protein